MPRGNDPEAAQEFRDLYGVSGNAEDLIRAHQASLSSEVQAASLRPIDDEATKELDLGSLDVEGEVISAAVRGNAIVAVVQGEDGRLSKTVLPADDSYKAPPQAPGEIVVQAQARADAEMQAAIERHRAEAALRLQEEKAAIDEELGQQLAEIREEQAKAIEEAQAEAEEQAEAEAEPKKSGGRAKAAAKKTEE